MHQTQLLIPRIICAGRFLEQDVKVFEDTMQLNYFGTLRIVKAFLPGMVKRKQGEVVLVSSAAAVCGVPLVQYASTRRGACANPEGALSLPTATYRAVCWMSRLVNAKQHT